MCFSYEVVHCGLYSWKEHAKVITGYTHTYNPLILIVFHELIVFSCRSHTCSDIRGVTVAGVEGEPVNLTERVTEAIAAAFAAWLLDKKKPDASRRLRVSIGHDSRISAQKLQVSIPDI